MSSLEVVSHKKKRKQDDAVAVTADADMIESTVSEKKHKKSKKSASDEVHDEQKATVEVVPVQKASKKAVSANESDPATAAAAVASVEDDLTPAQYRKKHEITVLGNDLEKIGIFMKFSDAPFPGPLQKTLIGAGFTAPSAIQAQAWPVAFAMRDCLAIAKTGSGKTLGFLLPTFSRILNSTDKTSKQPRMLVMSPTRELALQTAEQCVKFGRAIGIRATTIYGGAPKGPQIRDLTSGVHVVIGTPGRICDLMNFNGFDGKPVLKLGEVSTLVLDEADRMLDMGFEPSIREIVAMLPAERQTLFFTATWPKAVERIAYELLRENTVQINIGNAHEELVANKDVKQIVEVVDASDKFDKLTKTLAGADPAAPIIIFCNMKVRVQEIADQLWQSGASIDAIHGDKSQAEREYILKQFKRGDIKILVATDVAARGLDIKGVDLVVNYDFPRVVDDYVHRIGRTGRAGATGTAVTFFDPALDKAHAKELIKVMKDAGSDVPAALQALMPRSNGWGGGGGGRGGFRGGRGGGYGGRGGGGSGYGGRGGGRGGGGRGRW